MYKPRPYYGDLQQYIESELLEISRDLGIQDLLYLSERATAPSKTIVGMIALADGTNWDPGAGAGVYAYYGGAWNKLG